ncbi:12249_t:CDS:2, partial [Funneliformis mosseae]
MKPNLFMIFILALSSFTEIHTYTENTYNISENGLHFSRGSNFVLPNGSFLFRFYRPIDKDCNEPNLHLRILYKNGTLTTFEVENFSIPNKNFCRRYPQNPSIDHIEIFPFLNKLHLLYNNFSESDITAPIGRKLLTISLEGKILRDIWIGPQDPQFSGSFRFTDNTFYYFLPVDLDTFLWKKYDPILDGTGFIEIDNGTASLKYLSLQAENPPLKFATIDKGIGYIYSKNFPLQNNMTTDSLQPSIIIYVSFFIPEINDFTKPFIIYQTAISNITMKMSMCNPDITKFQYTCVIRLITSSSTTKLLLISFLSSGSVIDIQELYNEVYLNAFLVAKSNLYYGGYFMLYFDDPLGCKFGGEIYDNNDHWYSKLENFTIPFPCVSFSNDDENSFEMISEITPNSFTLTTAPLPKFVDDGRNYKLVMANIESVDPSYGSKISLGRDKLQINYANSIALSIRNITVLQINNEKNAIRQTTSGNISEFCSELDHKTVSIKLLRSTFNQPNKEYMIYIESNFVKQSETHEPIIGIKPFVWNLYTENEENPYAESFSGSVCLTPEGTDKFLDSNQTEFLYQLIQEISSILPVDLDRLESKGSYQIDASTQVIIPLQIKSTKDTYKRNADSLQKDFDIMIKYKGFTEISMNNYTSFLDQTYGYKYRVPTSINCTIAIISIIYENFYNNQFHEWFKLHVTVTSIFTILGATNIEALNILSSKFAGLSMFTANYSERIQIILFWVGLLDFIIEDIPQFIIQ